MSTSTVRSADQHPAPGSDVPGAPPALKRQLTGDDGRRTATRTSAQDARTSHPAPQQSTDSPTGVAPSGVTWYLPALGLLAAAATVAADTWWRRRPSRTS